MSVQLPLQHPSGGVPCREGPRESSSPETCPSKEAGVATPPPPGPWPSARFLLHYDAQPREFPGAPGGLDRTALVKCTCSNPLCSSAPGAGWCARESVCACTREGEEPGVGLGRAGEPSVFFLGLNTVTSHRSSASEVRAGFPIPGRRALLSSRTVPACSRPRSDARGSCERRHKSPPLNAAWPRDQESLGS